MLSSELCEVFQCIADISAKEKLRILSAFNCRAKKCLKSLHIIRQAAVNKFNFKSAALLLRPLWNLGAASSAAESMVSALVKLKYFSGAWS